MDFFKDVSRQLLSNSNAAHKRFKSTSGEPENSEDTNLFFELAVKSSTTQMAYLEHNRVKHMLLKSAFESFQ